MVDKEPAWAVVVQYGSWQRAASCASFLAAAGLPPSQIVLVANGPGRPPAPSPRSLRGCQLIHPQANLGFAGGCNLGLRQALRQGAQAILVLNPNTSFGPDLLEPLRTHGEDTWQVRAPEIFVASQPNRPWFAGAWRGAWPATLRRRPAGHRCRRVDYVWACALLARREVWRRVGLFDERYFLYYEDMDWCDRARRLGVELTIVPEARVFHAPGASSGGEHSPWRRYHMTRSAVLYHGRGGRRSAGPESAFFLARLARTAVSLAVGGRRAAFAAHLLGWRDGHRLLRALQAGQGLAGSGMAGPAQGASRPSGRPAACQQLGNGEG